MITATALIGKFQKALDDDWGYIWGTAGVKWTEAKQAAIEKTTDADRAQARKYGAKWIGHMVSDCSGLFTWAFRQLGGDMYHGSDTMYRKWCVQKGELRKGKRTDGAALKPGTAVFVWNGSKYSHVGLYIGGWVIEAASTQQGVIRSKVTASKWTNWGELKGVTFDASPAEPVTDEKPVIKKGSKGDAVRECQEILKKLGYDLGSAGVDGDFGTKTEKAVKAFQKAHDGPDGRALEVDGIVGQATWWALEHAEKQPETACTVTITGLSLEKAREIVSKYGGEITAG